MAKRKPRDLAADLNRAFIRELARKCVATDCLGDLVATIETMGPLDAVYCAWFAIFHISEFKDARRRRMAGKFFKLIQAGV